MPDTVLNALQRLAHWNLKTILWIRRSIIPIFQMSYLRHENTEWFVQVSHLVSDEAGIWIQSATITATNHSVSIKQVI